MKTLKNKTIITLLVLSIVSLFCFFCTTIKLPSKNVYANDPEIVFGDVNADGVMDVKDSIRLLKYLVDNSVSVDGTLCDANADGTVDADDAKRIIDVLNGYDLPLYKTVNIPATCSEDGLSARWSSKTGDANVYYNVLPKIEHENGVACASCGKTYKSFTAYHYTTRYDYHTTQYAVWLNPGLVDVPSYGAFDGFKIKVNGQPMTVRAQQDGRVDVVNIQNFGTATEGFEIRVDAGATFEYGNFVYVLSHGFTGVYTEGKWALTHDGHSDSVDDNDCVCDGFGCDYTEESFHNDSIDDDDCVCDGCEVYADPSYHTDCDLDGQCDGCNIAIKSFDLRGDFKYNHVADTPYPFINTSLEGYGEWEVLGNINVLHNGVPATYRIQLGGASNILLMQGIAASEGSEVVIPAGTALVYNNTLFRFNHKATMTFGTVWTVKVDPHTDNNSDGMCDGCYKPFEGISIVGNSKYSYPTAELYFYVNKAISSGPFTLLNGSAIDNNGTQNSTHTINQYYPNDPSLLTIANFGTATEGYKVIIPEGYSFENGQAIYYFRETISFTYTNGNWVMKNISIEDFASTFSANPILIVNEDRDILTRFYDSYNGDLSDIENKVEQYFNVNWKDKGICDLYLNIDGVVPSQYNYKENDIQNQKSDLVLEACEVAGIDPFVIWSEMCRANGIAPYLSFRMNDVHWQGRDERASNFQATAKANGWLLMNKGRSDYYSWCLDYSVLEVREYFINYIIEMIGRYDYDGIELDFQREIHCFAVPGLDENVECMNSFMEELNTRLAEVITNRDHDIKIAVRVNRDIENSKRFGFDLIEWAENGWVDILIPSSSYGSTDSDMPVAQWIETFAPYNVEVIPGLETHVYKMGSTYTNQNRETISAYINAYLGAGAEKVYAFNMFANFGDYSGQFPLWQYMSTESGVMSCEKRYVVTYEEYIPYGYTGWDPLPMRVEGSKSLDIQVGTLRNNVDKIIFVGVANGVDVENLLSVTANGTACTFIGESDYAFISSYNPSFSVYAFKVDASVVAVDNEIKFEFSSQSEVVIQYVEFFNGLYS